jgi:hypothetical protein
MEPDILIQQKAWNELSATERESVKDIAATEQEYNLLRQMLSVAAAPGDIPVLGEQVLVQLQAELPAKPATIISINKWYYIAAAAAVLLLALFFLLPGTKNERPAMVKNERTGVDVPPVTVNNKDTQTNSAIPADPALVKDAKKKVDTNNFVKDLPRKQNTPLPNQPPVLNDLPPTANTTVSVNTTIAADPSLLALVTEVY